MQPRAAHGALLRTQHSPLGGRPEPLPLGPRATGSAAEAARPTARVSTPRRKRFVKDIIYTLVGDILIAVNPFKAIEGMYTREKMAACRGKKLHNAACGPHIYAVG